MINHPDILADIARQHRAEMMAAADEFRHAKQMRTLRKPARKLRRPFSSPKAPRASSSPASIQTQRNSKATPAKA